MKYEIDIMQKLRPFQQNDERKLLIINRYWSLFNIPNFFFNLIDEQIYS